MLAYDLFFRNFIPPKAYQEALGKLFGARWLDWEPETLLAELRRALGVTPTSIIQDKIFALQTYLKTSGFWDNPLIFENMILAFGDRYVDPDLIQGCLPDELAYGMTVAGDLPKPQGTALAEDIVEYIRGCHREAGVLVYHPVLAFAQPEYTGEIKRIADEVKKLIDKDVIPKEPVDLDDPVQVQLAKSRDVGVYVQERLDRGVMPDVDE